jgi:hypothetical protein
VATHKTFQPNRLLIYIVVASALFLCALLGAPATAHAEDDNAINSQQLPDSSFIYDTSIVEISKADAYFDNQTVQVVGEVVGDSLNAGPNNEYRWITLLSEDADSNASVTVYMSALEAEKIDTFGKYGSTGTKLRINGTYHLVCAEHEGISDIHADQVSVTEAGRQNPEALDLYAFIPGAVAVLVGLILVLVFSRLHEKRR